MRRWCQAPGWRSAHHHQARTGGRGTLLSGGTLLAAQFRRLAVRRGKQKASVAVGHHLLILVYALLAHGEVYQERDPRLLDERRRTRTPQRALDQLHPLGYTVTLAEPALLLSSDWRNGHPRIM